MTRSVRSVALLGNFLPRQCGIATFTADLAAAIVENDPGIDCFTVAMNDRPEGYEYPSTVRFQIQQGKLNDYSVAADYLNTSGVDAVSLQHEYGIFGGQRGSFIIELARSLKMPLITTLHTILRDPSPLEHWIITELAHLSEFLVVMSERGKRFLRETYRVPEAKIRLIHHGIPDIPFLNQDPCRSKFVADDKIMILTFGLLSPGKGIEFMVDALPDIIRTHPQVLYFVVGATHPHLRAESGEDYRLSLHHRAEHLGVAEHIVFYDRFLDRADLLEIIRAADLYVTPYLNEAQIVSGTLAYALGAGKAVVSTPYWHALEMLADNRGRLVPFRDPQALATTINELLERPEECHAMRADAYEYCRPMVMAEMGRHYLEVIAAARDQHVQVPREQPALETLSGREPRLPQINLEHVRLMTDGTGMLQHAKFTVPDRAHGYCVDDNARALIAVIRAHSLNKTDDSLTELSTVYLSFLDDAFNRETGRFRNFMSFNRQWLEETGSEDAHGRAVWALGVVAGHGLNQGQVAVATGLFWDALPALDSFSDSRAIAFPILGIQAYLHRNGDDHRALGILKALGNRLQERFRKYATDNWLWHEEMLAYDNARLPQALMACGHATNDDEMVSLGLRVLQWLRDIQIDPSGGWFSPVGNQGWYSRSGSKAQYDQQPLEAAAMIAACTEAHACTGDDEWVQLASTCFSWYLGNNDQRIKLYDHTGGGCRDGLHAAGVNENRGAESTLSYVLSLLAIYNLRGLTTGPNGAGEQAFANDLPEPQEF